MIKTNLFIVIIISFLVSCSSNNQLSFNDTNTLDSGSKIIVKPKIISESAYEGFYISDKLEKKLNQIQFSSTEFLKGDENCIGLIRLSVSGSIDYYQLINTLKKRAYDMGGNAIGVYDYKESRKVLINQHGYKVFDKDKSIFQKPKINYVLVKENRKIAKITADIFKCNNKST